MTETMTGKEAIFATGMSEDTLGEWAREGKVTAWKDEGNRWIFDVESLISHARRHREHVARTRGQHIAELSRRRARDERFR